MKISKKIMATILFSLLLSCAENSKKEVVNSIDKKEVIKALMC